MGRSLGEGQGQKESEGRKKTNYNDGTHVHISLGSSASRTGWQRFERNIEADWEAYSGESWLNTDGILVRPDATLSYDIEFSMIRLSNSLTAEHNVLGPGVIGHIVRNRTVGTLYMNATDKYFHYDQVGSVIAVTASNGALSTRRYADSFGNTVSSLTTGLWGNTSGWGHNTKETT